MALFGKSDRGGVPLLTAFYQISVDVENPVGGELDVLMFRHTFKLPQSLCLWSESYPNWHPDEQLRIVAETHPLVTRIMNAAVDKHSLRSFENTGDKLGMGRIASDVNAFNRLVEKTLMPPQLFSPGRGDEDNGLVMAYMPTRDASDSTKNVRAKSFIADVLAEFIPAFQQGRLARCEECKSVFDASRDGVRFCSERCRSRKNSREHKRKKNQKLTV